MNNQEQRILKLKSITMNPLSFWVYVKYMKVKNYLNDLLKEEFSIKKKWYSFYISAYKTFSMTWREANYDESKAHINICFLWFHLYIYTSQKYAVYDKETYDYLQGDREYGIKIHNDSFWIYKGLNTKSFNFPYTYRHIRSSALRKDGIWEHDYSRLGKKVCRIKDDYYKNIVMKDGSITKDYSKNFWEEDWDNILFKQVFDYTYVLENGTIQKRKATVKVEEREWRRWFLLWFKWKAKISKYLSISFDSEVGERSGSYKGGVTGISCQFLNDKETVEECFKRFEKTKKM